MNLYTSRWKLAAELVPYNKEAIFKSRKKRQGAEFITIIQGIPINFNWYNFASIVQSMCYSKIRVYRPDGITQIRDASVGVIRLAGQIGNSVSNIRARTDRYYPGNGYCIVHPAQMI